MLQQPVLRWGWRRGEDVKTNLLISRTACFAAVAAAARQGSLNADADKCCAAAACAAATNRAAARAAATFAAAELCARSVALPVF